jgi:hypothetical protein
VDGSDESKLGVVEDLGVSSFGASYICSCVGVTLYTLVAAAFTSSSF